MIIAGYILLISGFFIDLCTITYIHFAYLRSWKFYWLCVNAGEARATVLVILIVFALGLIFVGIVDLSVVYFSRKKDVVVSHTGYQKMSYPDLNSTMTVADLNHSHTYLKRITSYDYPTEVPGTIVGIKGVPQGLKIPLKKKEQVIIGRNPDMCNLVIDDRLCCVSRRHCVVRFDYEKDLYEIYDCSRNGTYCNGKKLRKNTVTETMRGTVLCLGSPDVLFRLS